ncbi:MAG: Fic family protein [Parcubacteria group bacterium]|nr:Fic family protein [Parcubacteria group bacterium]
MAKYQGETSYKETAFGVIPRSKLIPLEIEGIKKAWDFVLRKRSKGKLPLTPKFIKETHKIGFGWIFPAMGGRYRNIEVKVSKHTPPKFYRIPQLLEEFTKDLQTRIRHLPRIENKIFLDELISLLAWSHHKFLWIHPFQDYNGRIGRLLNNMILLNLDLPPIELKVETTSGRKIYIKALQAADNFDYSKLEKIVRSSISEAVTELKVKKERPQ